MMTDTSTEAVKRIADCVNTLQISGERVDCEYLDMAPSVLRALADAVNEATKLTDMIPRAEADAMVAAVIDWYDGLVGESTGVAGYHLNGDAAGWGEFDRPTCPDDARAALKAMLAEARMEGYRDGWRFAYRQSEQTGSVPDPDYAAIRAEAGE